MNSPCDKTCKISNGVCNGCGRTLNDIKLWSNATELEKQAIIVRAAGGNKMERQIELMRLANKSVFTIARELNIGEDEVLAVIAGLKMPLPRSKSTGESAAIACKKRRAIEAHHNARIEQDGHDPLDYLLDY